METSAIFQRVKRSLHVAFSLVLTLLWFDELFDIPHLLGFGPPTPVNVAESAIESLAVCVIWFITLRFINAALARVNILEGMLSICSSCKKIRTDDGHWEQLEEYVTKKSEAEFSHALCPACMRKLYPDIADDILENGE